MADQVLIRPCPTSQLTDSCTACRDVYVTQQAPRFGDRAIRAAGNMLPGRLRILSRLTFGPGVEWREAELRLVPEPVRH